MQAGNGYRSGLFKIYCHKITRAIVGESFFIPLCFLDGDFSVCRPAAGAEELIQLIPPAETENTAETAVLSPLDKTLYTQIFSHLDNGAFKEAEILLETVEDNLLKGYVLAQIYLAEESQPTKKQLGDWLKKYADLPIAEEVYNLAAKKKAPLPRKKPSDPAAHMAAGACTSIRIADPIDLVFFKRASYVPEPERKKVRMSMLYFSSAIRRGKTLAAKLHLNEKHVKNICRKRSRRFPDGAGFCLFYRPAGRKSMGNDTRTDQACGQTQPDSPLGCRINGFSHAEMGRSRKSV